jgi:hypothetical protein
MIMQAEVAPENQEKREANIQKQWSCKPHRKRKLLLRNRLHFLDQRNAISSRLRSAWILYSSSQIQTEQESCRWTEVEDAHSMGTSTRKSARNQVL